jgi:hypothetical protein
MMYVTMYAMSEMVRKQVYIAPRHERLLKEHAREYRVTEAELIRQALDRGLAPETRATTDPDAWNAMRRYIERHRRPLKAKAAPRRWTRDSLHDR